MRPVLITDPLMPHAAGAAPNGHEHPVRPTPFTGSVPARELPAGYGDNLIRLLVRDPNYLFTYWEIRGEVESDALARLGGNRADVRSVLRVYDITERAAHSPFFDIPLQNMAVDWYIEVRPNHSYVVEIGLLHRDGRFIALARSNEVTTPRDGMSDVIDEEWMGIDFDRIYALSGGFRVGLSSMEMKEQMKMRLQSAVTSGSGGMTSPVKPAAKARKFWFELDCELIVRGATEPDAAVTVNGQRVELRPDGTFSLRYELPDGQIHLDARAISSDLAEERQIAPSVERKTRSGTRKLKTNGKRA